MTWTWFTLHSNLSWVPSPFSHMELCQCLKTLQWFIHTKEASCSYLEESCLLHALSPTLLNILSPYQLPRLTLTNKTEILNVLYMPTCFMNLRFAPCCSPCLECPFLQLTDSYLWQLRSQLFLFSALLTLQCFSPLWAHLRCYTHSLGING